MSSINKNSDPLDDFTEEQLANLDKSINTLDQEEKRWSQEQREAIDADMAPFGFISDGMDDESFVDEDGDRWHADEYGDRTFMWEYR